MYFNLEAEMARHGLNRKDLAAVLGVRYATVIDKLKGRYGFTLDEAFKIKNKLFPELSLEYLFDKQEMSAAAGSENGRSAKDQADQQAPAHG